MDQTFCGKDTTGVTRTLCRIASLLLRGGYSWKWRYFADRICCRGWIAKKHVKSHLLLRSWQCAKCIVIQRVLLSFNFRFILLACGNYLYIARSVHLCIILLGFVSKITNLSVCYFSYISFSTQLNFWTAFRPADICNEKNSRKHYSSLGSFTSDHSKYRTISCQSKRFPSVASAATFQQLNYSWTSNTS